MSDEKTNPNPDVALIRQWQLAGINHLEDLHSNGSVIKDIPPDGSEALVCITAVMDNDAATAFCEIVANLLNAALGTESVQINPPEALPETTH